MTDINFSSGFTASTLTLTTTTCLNQMPSTTTAISALWKNISESYFMKIIMKSSNIEISITDSKSLWKKIISESEVIEISKAKNSFVEASDKTFLLQSLNLFHSPTTVYKIEKEVENLTCSLKSGSGVIAFEFSFSCDLGNSDSFYDEVTIPLLISVHKLRKQQKELLQIIQAKDEEIREYKLSGGKLYRKSLATKVFNKEDFLSKEIFQGENLVNNFEHEKVFKNCFNNFCDIRNVQRIKEVENVPNTTASASITNGKAVTSSSVKLKPNPCQNVQNMTSSSSHAVPHEEPLPSKRKKTSSKLSKLI